jgi:Lon-like protease
MSDNDTESGRLTQDVTHRAVASPVVTPPGVHRWWAVPAAVSSIVVTTAVLAMSVLPATLRAENPDNVEAPFARVPAGADPVGDRLGFDAVPRFDADGEFLFVTIREPEINLLDWWIGEKQPEIQFLSRVDKFGEQTPEQERQINVQSMRTAKETAEFVALSYLGFPAEMVPGDVVIGSILCLRASADGTVCEEFAPSDAVLDPGDQLIEVDGTEVVTIEDLGPILEQRAPGDVITVRFERPGEGEREGEVELIGGDDGRTLIGFAPFDTATADLPFEIAIDSGAIGGPSAGLAFTLSLIDALTEGELTGGRRVAVTGTIRLDGSVGAIGGLIEKTSAVRQGSATIFLIPTEQGEEQIAAARAIAGDDVEIVPVATLQEAIDALADRGGNGRELGQPGLDFEPAG